MRLIDYIKNYYGTKRGNKTAFCSGSGLLFPDVSRMLAADDWEVIEHEGQTIAFKLSQTKSIWGKSPFSLNNEVTMSYEQDVLNDYIGQLAERFTQFSQSQQHDVLDSIKALITEPKKITNARPQADVLSDLRAAIEHGDRADLFFTTAFPCWYRRTPEPRVAHLHEWMNLDLSNRHLFLEMLALRDSGRFDDEALYQFERYCLDKRA